MNAKRFEYFHKDIKQLKIDIGFRIFFSVLFIACFIWQMVLTITTSINGSLSFMQGIVSGVVMVTSMVLCLVTFSYAFKDFRIISAIKMNGKCVSSVSILFSTKKAGFVRLYHYLIQFLTLAVSLILIAGITYSILQVTILSTISFYMPLLLTICVSGYNSIYHIKDEITTQNTVQEQRPLY